MEISNCRISGVGNEAIMNLENRKGKFDTAYIFIEPNGYGIQLVNCTQTIVKNSKIIDVFGQGVRITGDNNQTTSDITIESNRIAYIYDDAVKFEVKGDQNDQSPELAKLPFKGGVVRNNIIHDIGLGVTRLPFARHGMYLKAADILVEGNTIYNCFYGSGISLRNAGIIRNNTIWNCAYACIAYHAQTKTTESTKEVIIENNNCLQEYGMDFPMRHIANPTKGFNACVYGCIMLGIDNKQADSPLFIEQFIVRNNTCKLYKDYPSELDKRTIENDYPKITGRRPIPMLHVGGRPSETKLEINGNTFMDNRKQKCYFNTGAVVGIDTSSNVFK